MYNLLSFMVLSSVSVAAAGSKGSRNVPGLFQGLPSGPERNPSQRVAAAGSNAQARRNAHSPL